MGRRSTSSTKSGKFMNPTDQARKEARKRELKKNKKQRMMVRAAVLKMKDPKQIIRDMEKLDEMEFNPVQQPQLNEKVLKDKRKKLRETFERILRLYEKENPDIYKELRKLEVEYEQKRAQLSQYFDAVKPNEVMTMMFLAPVKMMAILRTWIRISMMTVLMTVTPTNQMEKVTGMNLCTVMMVRETIMKKRSQVCADEGFMVLINKEKTS
uniref:Wbp11/ELF5/Saf1 N-terminal domain-containing protein n=1 Tax=Colobus angolensis palliatus TaxID=336983 RepID=A0A2K5IDJ3_COLAP